MAKSNSLTGAVAPVPPHGGPAIDLQLIDRALASMTSLVNLAEWIGHARDFIGGVDFGKRACPEFAALLRKRDFAGVQPDWDEEVAEGMDCLHHALREQIEVISKAIRPEVQP